MRSFTHWNITYITNRINEIIYHRTYPDHPWLTKSANLILQSILKDSDVGLEFGSGRSTMWTAKRLAFLTSVEHDESWYQKVNGLLKESNLSNVEYIFCPENHHVGEQEAEYPRIAERFADNSLDYVLIDGIYRDICANAVVDKVGEGGVLVIDNVNWYLPSKSISPDSRSLAEGPASRQWAEFQRRVENWRCIWTSSGVSDTAIYLKPCSK